MNQRTPAGPSLQAVALRALRMAASTIAIVELLRHDWTGGGLAALAWLLLPQVERLHGAGGAANRNDCF